MLCELTFDQNLGHISIQLRLELRAQMYLEGESAHLLRVFL